MQITIIGLYRANPGKPRTFMFNGIVVSLTTVDRTQPFKEMRMKNRLGSIAAIILVLSIFPTAALAESSVSISAENISGRDYKLTIKGYSPDTPITCSISISPASSDSGTPLKTYDFSNCENEQSVTYTLPGNGVFEVTAKAQDKAGSTSYQTIKIEYDMASGCSCSSVGL
jgi:hypothetical protein